MSSFIVDCNLEGLFVTDEDPLYLQQIQQFQVQLQKGFNRFLQDYFQIPSPHHNLIQI